MTPVTLYLDNSVIGGYFDDGFEEATRKLWLLAEAGRYRFVASVVTEREAARAPERVYNLFLETFIDPESILGLETRGVALAQSYVDNKVVSSKYIDDAQPARCRRHDPRHRRHRQLELPPPRQLPARGGF
jgi:hypothetical protein